MNAQTVPLHQHSVIIRPARDEDGAAIAHLIASIFAEYDGCLFAADEFPELAAPASHYDKRGGYLQVAEAGDGSGQIVGCCAVLRTTLPDRFELSKVYVHKELRGSGLAQTLVGAAKTFAVDAGGKVLELFTDTRFLGAHRFYRKLGFIQIAGERYLADVSSSWEFHFVQPLE